MSAAILLALLAGGAPHPGPPVFVELVLERETLQVFVHGEQRILGEWLALEDLSLEPPLSEAARARILTAAPAMLEAAGQVSVDGSQVRFAAVAVQSLGPFAGSYGAEPSLVLELRAALADPAQAIDVRWDEFPEDTRGGVPKVPVHIRTEGGFDYQVLTAEEPAWTWHRPSARGLDLAPVEVSRSGGRASGRVLLVLVLMAAGGGLLSTASTAGGGGGAVRALGVVLLGAGTWLLLGPGPVEQPSEERALALHEQLLRRVYAAFEETTERGVFRLLAASVSPDLVEPLYEGIHESLVLADEGGAVCRVQALDILSAEVAPRADAGGAAFTVDTTWRVDGRVIHFGHEHDRRTRYQGRLTIGTSDGEAWRIRGLEVREQVREPVPAETLDPDGTR